MSENTQEKITFEPLEIMGVFWIAFGVIILFSTFFIEHTETVPLVRGVITNLISGSILFIAGLFSFWKGRFRNRKQV